MRVLVVGGTLFIGRALVARLLERGHEVAVLHRRPAHKLGGSVENLVADRNDGEAVRAALAGRKFDAVFDNVYDWQRETTADQVTATARACGGNLRRYVFMSSVAAYGSGLDHVESDELASADDPDSYVRNKAASERALLTLHAREGFPAVTLRPPYVYGDRNPFYREQFFWDRLRLNRPIIVPEDGSRLMQFVYVHDLVKMCLLALDREECTGRAFNIGDPAPLMQSEVVRAIARAAGMEPRLVYVPRAKLIEGGGHPMLPPLYFATYFDMPPITMNTAAARKLGWTSTPFDEGLAATYRWYLEHHKPPALDFSYEDRMLG